MGLLSNRHRIQQLIAFVFCLLIISCFYSSFTFAQDIQPQIITINGGGSITPDNGLIEKKGNTYLVTEDTSQYSILVNCSNIILDGQGHAIGCPTGFFGPEVGLHLENVGYVTVQNIKIQDLRNNEFKLENCNNCTVRNIDNQRLEMQDCSGSMVTNCKLLNLYIWGSGSTNNLIDKNQMVYCNLKGSNNIICRNNITGELDPCGSNDLYYENNIYQFIAFLGIEPNRWDNGFVGNFWWNYLWNKPAGSVNMSVVDGLTIGDKAYTIAANNVDHHPLIYPYIATDKPTSKTDQTLIQPLAIVLAAAIVATVLCATIVLLYYRRVTIKRKQAIN
jgi:hypothetical protein